MNDLFDSVARTLAPIYNCTPIKAIREGMFVTAPVLVVGSLSLILFQLPVETLARFVMDIGAVPYLAHVYTSTFQICGLVAAAGIAASWARNKQLAAAPAAAIAVALMLINSPDFITAGEYDTISGLDKTWISGQGITTAILSGTITGAIYCPIMRMLSKGNNDTSFCMLALYACVPAFAVLTAGFVWYSICDAVFAKTPVELFYELCKAPFALTTSGSFGDVLTWEVFKPLLWWLGIHGAVVVGSASSPIAEANLVQNSNLLVSLLNAGLSRSEAVGAMSGNGACIYTSALSSAFSTIGGVGITQGLCISLIVFAKNTRLRILGIIGLVLSFFNINEPVLFCVVIFNPAMLIPFVLMPAISMTLAYGLTALGLMSYSTGVTVPWTTPAVLNGLLMGGWSWAFVQLIVLAISCVVYAPFVMVTDRLSYSEDHEGKLDGYGGKLTASARMPRAGAPMAAAAGVAGNPNTGGGMYGYAQMPGQPGQQANGQVPGQQVPGQQANGQAPGQQTPGQWGYQAYGQVPGQPAFGRVPGAQTGPSPSGQAVQPRAYGPGAEASSQEFSGDFAGYDPDTGRPIYK